MKPAGEDFLFGFATAGIRLVYYNLLIMVHRIPLIVHFVHARHIPPDRQKASDLRLIANQSATSATICLQAARDTLKLVNSLPWGDIAWIWSLLYYVFLAVITIFAHVMEDSRHPKAKEDVNLLNIASTFLGTLIPADGSCKYARFMAQMSANFERIARANIERFEGAGESLEYRTSTSVTASPGPGHAPSNESRSPCALHHAQCRDSGYVTSPASNVNVAMNIPRVDLAASSLAAPDTHNNGYHQPCQGIPDELPNSICSNYTTTNNTPAAPVNTQFYTNPATNLFPTNPTSAPTTHTKTPSTENLYPFSNPNTDHNSCATPADSCTGTDTGPCFVPPPPNLWQIPLTADWEFNQFLNGVPPGILPGPGTGMGTDTATNANAGYAFDLSTPGLGINPGPVPQSPSPSMDTGNIMDYDYGTQPQAQMQNQNMNQSQGQQQHQLCQQFMDAQTPAQVIDNVVWFGGFAGF